MKNQNKQKGFSLIEILIGVGIFAVIFIGVSYLMLNNLQASFDNQEKIKADFLVVEGLEAVKAIAGNDWDQVKPGTYGLKLSGNQWELVTENEKVTQMAKNGERIITITDLAAPNVKKVESAVVWQSMTNNVKTSTAVTLLTNWRSYVSLCSDGIDNDGDGNADYPTDPGCGTPADEDEYNDPANNETYICSDGLDNDGDGNTDYPNDPGCSSAADNDETNPEIIPQCSDNLDNDGDGNADYPNDPGCDSAVDNDETDPLNPTQCSDGLDNDGDGKIDYPQDGNCDSAEDDDESQSIDLPACSDGKDNDNDGNIDYPNDPGCEAADDNDETDSLNPPDCSDNLDNDNDGTIDYPDDLGCQSPDDNDETAPGNPPSCVDNDKDFHNAAQENCGPADCDDNNAAINPDAAEICDNGNDDNCNGLIDCQDQSCSQAANCQTVAPDVIFDTEDIPLCKLEQGTLNVTGKVVLAEGKTAKLLLSYYIVWPEDKRTEIVYVNKGTVSNDAYFSLLTPWPGVRKNEIKIETHIGAMLLDTVTGNPLMANSSSLDYYWYPWVCPAPKPQCSDNLDNDNDGLIDFPLDPSCLSADDDNEGTNNCGIDSDQNYDYSCHYDDEDEQIEVKIKNNNNRGFSNAAISLPAGVAPVSPKAGEIYQGLQGTYSVEITNNPFYSIKFNNIGDDGYNDGREEIFSLTFAPADYDKIEDLKIQSKSAIIIGNVIFTVK